MEMKLFSYYILLCTCFAVELQMSLKNIAINKLL